MGFSYETANRVLDLVFGSTAYSPPGTLAIGLSTTAVEDDGSEITEPEGGGYERAVLANTPASWNDAAEDTEKGYCKKTNAVTISFPGATDTWGVISHFFLMQDSVLIAHGALSHPKLVVAGDAIVFQPGELQITLD